MMHGSTKLKLLSIIGTTVFIESGLVVAGPVEF
jgi:hypothetical protein